MTAVPTTIQVLRRELPEYDVPAALLSVLAEIPSGSLSRYLAGAAQPGLAHLSALRDAWADLKSLIEQAKPLPLDFRKIQTSRQCIEKSKAGALRISVADKTTGPEATRAEETP